MKTNYQSINLFEVAVVGMITIGFVLIGVILFSGLTPRSQTNVASAFNMFDIHEQMASTVNSTIDSEQFVMDVPNEFYNQFYVAFNQVATMPSDTFDLPVAVAAELARNITVTINNLSDQVAEGYAEQVQTQDYIAELTQGGTMVAYENLQGKVLGASIDRSFKNSTAGCGSVTGNTTEQTLKMTYGYNPPDLDKLILALTKLIK
jgi:hypothetical protein